MTEQLSQSHISEHVVEGVMEVNQYSNVILRARLQKVLNFVDCAFHATNHTDTKLMRGQDVYYCIVSPARCVVQ
jgi:hypothetical protein